MERTLANCSLLHHHQQWHGLINVLQNNNTESNELCTTKCLLSPATGFHDALGGYQRWMEGSQCALSLGMHYSWLLLLLIGSRKESLTAPLLEHSSYPTYYECM